MAATASNTFHRRSADTPVRISSGSAAAATLWLTGGGPRRTSWLATGRASGGRAGGGGEGGVKEGTKPRRSQRLEVATELALGKVEPLLLAVHRRGVQPEEVVEVLALSHRHPIAFAPLDEPAQVLLDPGPEELAVPDRHDVGVLGCDRPASRDEGPRVDHRSPAVERERRVTAP